MLVQRPNGHHQDQGCHEGLDFEHGDEEAVPQAAKQADAGGSTQRNGQWDRPNCWRTAGDNTVPNRGIGLLSGSLPVTPGTNSQY